MGREIRPNAINTVYHVIARGNNREALFLSDIDRETYLRLWKKYSRELEFDIYAYVLMTNHVHWLIRTGRVPISTIIHTIHSVYARIFNQTHKRGRAYLSRKLSRRFARMTSISCRFAVIFTGIHWKRGWWKICWNIRGAVTRTCVAKEVILW